MPKHCSEPFWMVYGLNQGAPNVVHNTFESAERESRRLAANNPGIKFYVLASVACAEKMDVSFRSINPDDIPF